MYEVIDAHYKEHAFRLIKNYSFRAGSIQDAEDLVHDAYERAMKYFDSFNQDEEFARWFRVILSNTARDFKKKERGFVMNEFEEEHFDGVPCQQFNEETIKQVYEFIDSKEPANREALFLHFKHGYSATDVCAITGGRYVTVHSQLHRFREELKEMFQYE